MKWHIPIVLLAVTVVATSNALAEPPLATENADRHWHAIAALNFPRETHTAFRETRSSKLLRKPAQQSGTLWIEEDGDFVMQVLKPRPEERRLSDRRLHLTRGAKQRSVMLDRNKGAHQLLLSIVAVLEGNVEHLQTHFEIQSLETDAVAVTDTWSVVLTPIDPTLRKTLQRLVLRGNTTSLLSLRAERSASRWQEIVILPSAVNSPEQSLNE